MKCGIFKKLFFLNLTLWFINLLAYDALWSPSLASEMAKQLELKSQNGGFHKPKALSDTTVAISIHFSTVYGTITHKSGFIQEQPYLSTSSCPVAVAFG